MEHEHLALPKIEKDSNLRERLSKILEQIESASAAQNPGEAHTIIASAFASVEKEYSERGEAKKLMRVDPVSDMTSANYAGKNILFRYYDSHALLLGEKGAIEIRSTRGKEVALPDEASSEFQKYPLILEKAGADGKLLWE